MKALHHRVYRGLTVLALLLALCLPGHAQDTALPDEQKTLMQYMMQERPVMAALVTKAGLTPILSDDAAYTVLAPPEADLQKLQELPAERLRAVLSGHILKGLYREKDFKDGATIETLAHTRVNVCRKKDYTLVDGIRVGGSTQVKNGILHSLSGKLNI